MSSNETEISYKKVGKKVSSMPSCVTRQNSAASSPVVTDSGAAGISNMTTGTSGGPMMGMPQAPINGNGIIGSMQNTTPQQQPSPSTGINNNQMMNNPEAAQQFCLRWNSYPATVATQLAALRAAEDFVDVTLACDGRQLRAHKLVLSACSPYFMQLFKSTPCKHPVIFLKDVGFRQLVALLEFMYAGEVNVSQAELPALLRTAEALQVRGLADTTPNNSLPSPPKPGFPQTFGTSLGMEQNTMSGPQSAQTQGDTLDPTSGSMFSAQNATNPPCDTSSNACSNNSTGKRSQKHDDEEDSDSQEFDMGCMEDASKQEGYFNDTGSLSQQFDGTGEEFGQSIGDTGSFDLSQGDLANGLLTGENHTDEESEDVEEDENSLDCSKDLTGFPNDGSFGQNLDLGGSPNGEASGNTAGSSMNSSGMPNLEPVNAMAITKSAVGMPNSTLPPPLPGMGLGRGRNRLARSMFPMQSNYHGAQQCPYCNKHLSNVGNWRKHVLTMHFAREKMFKCEMCPSSFRTTEYLQKHYVRVHNFPQKMTRKKITEKS